VSKVIIRLSSYLRVFGWTAKMSRFARMHVRAKLRFGFLDRLLIGRSSSHIVLGIRFPTRIGELLRKL
jgi:hypothetical protein